MSARRSHFSPGVPGDEDHPKEMREALLRRHLLGGPDDIEKLAMADAENEAVAQEHGFRSHMMMVVLGAVFLGWSWSGDGLGDLWNLVWFLPLVLVGAVRWYGSERSFGALADQVTRPFRAHTYTPNFYGDEDEEAPDYSMAEIVTDEPPDAARIVPDASWSPPPGIWVKPRGDWGFVETIDGELAEPFELQIDEAGAPLFDGTRGWRGRILSARHKYGYMDFTMKPRHAPFDGIVSIAVTNGANSIYSGMAETRGLECDWL